MSRPDPDDGSVDVEAAWAEIVARWDDPPAAARSDPSRPDPSRPDPSRSDPSRSDPSRPDPGPPGSAGTGTGTDTGAGTDTDAGRGTDTGEPATATGGPGTRDADAALAAAGTGAPARPEDVGRDGADDWNEDWEPPRSHVGGERVLRAAQEDERTGRDGDLAAHADTERFIPPEPPPLPRGDLPSRLAWGGVLGAPLFFLVCALFWRDVPGLLVVAGIVAFVAGFGALVVRMPVSRDGDDDGAVV